MATDTKDQVGDGVTVERLRILRINACSAWSNVAKLPIELDEKKCNEAQVAEAKLAEAIDSLTAELTRLRGEVELLKQCLHDRNAQAAEWAIEKSRLKAELAEERKLKLHDEWDDMDHPFNRWWTDFSVGIPTPLTMGHKAAALNAWNAAIDAALKDQQP